MLELDFTYIINTMASHFIVECLDCGYSTPYFPTSVSCPRCGSGWREAVYDYANLALTLPLQLPGRPFDVWRYKELLPIRDHVHDLSLGEGGTPLLKAVNLGTMLQCPNIFIKDERQNPTSSFKDRQAAVTIAALIESGINEIVTASSGNISLAYSAYAARAGIKLWAFLSSRVPASKINEMLLYGSRVITVTGTYEKTKQVALEFARQRNIFMDQSTQTVPSVEAMKTIAFEITEQLTAHMGTPPGKNKTKPPFPWRAPDWYLQAVSIGLGPLGVLKGFSELRLMGLIERVPLMGIIQPEGSSAMVNAWTQGLDVAEPLDGINTDVENLCSMDPGRTYTLLARRIEQESGGKFESVTDKETYKAMQLLARMEGISAEPAAAVSFAGLIKLCNQGLIKEKDVVVVNCTGHTASANMPNVHQRFEMASNSIPHEFTEDGILATLTQYDFSQFFRVLVAHSDDSFRSILISYAQLHGAENVIEAKDTQQTTLLMQSEAPDLLLLDFYHTEFNGLGILDTLFKNGNNHIIPIICLTTSDFTDDERAYLQNHFTVTTRTQGIMTTSSSLSDQKSILEIE
jgi:threonine synthase